MNKKFLFSILALALLSGCGVDAASTAATVATMKKQELEQGKRDMARIQQQAMQGMQAEQQRANQIDDQAAAQSADQ